MKASVRNSKVEISFSGIVERIVYHNAENGWTVLKVSTLNSSKNLVSVVLYQAKVFAGSTMEFFGSWTRNSKYGEQFLAHRSIEKKPASNAAMEKYLGSGLIRGVGPMTAKKIVSHFKESTLDVFENKIEDLTQVRGIGIKKLTWIQKSWKEHKSIRDVMLFLQEFEISTLFAVKIFKTYGNEAISLVSKNPYRLARDIHGIGFLSSDRIALRMGWKKDSPQRIKAGIQHCLFLSQDQGHCYLLEDQIIENVREILGEEILSNDILTALKELELENQVKTRHLEKDSQSVLCYYSPPFYYYEIQIVKSLRKMMEKNLTIDLTRVREGIHFLCKKAQIQLSEEQRNALYGIIQSPFSILTGGPGCGKTTTTKILVDFLLQNGRKVILTAPTGRAAQRMTEVVQKVEAKTIHRTLKWMPREGRFQKNENDLLEGDFLIVDEVSMLDVSITSALFLAVPSPMQVLLIGDPDQLPSIGAGNVLKDLVDSKFCPCFQLKTIFRQSQKSMIVKFAHEINLGQIPKIPSPLTLPNAFQKGHDCLFVDSAEMTMEQKTFIQKVKTHFESSSASASSFSIPEKFKNVNLDRLREAQSEISLLKELSGPIPTWSTLHYNMTATESLIRLYTHSIKKWLKDNSTEIQVLSPQVRGTLGTQNLNLLLQKEVNPLQNGKASFRIGNRLFIYGDRVIQTKNNYDLNVFNGDIGKISAIDSSERQIKVLFHESQKKELEKKRIRGREVLYEEQDILDLDLAYAITIHKSQGSEFDVVILPITYQHYNMLFRNLIYTGITRAKKLSLFIGSRKALAVSIRRVKTDQRQTTLKDLLVS